MPVESDVNVQGGCQCGEVRYQLTGEPQTLYLCHCKACQKQSSSAFGMSLRMLRQDVVISGNSLKFWHTQADSGTPKVAAFCGNCGTRLYNCRDHHSETINIKAGSLDDTSQFKPVANLWTRRAQTWYDIDSDALNYDAQPENYEAVCQRWTLLNHND